MWEYRAALVRVLDGDTARLLIDCGYSVRTEQDIRLLDVSCPELAEPGGVQCVRFAIQWLADAPRLKWPLVVTTSPTQVAEPTERRSFVRYLGTVEDTTGRSLNGDLNTYLTEHPEWGHGT